MIPELPLFPEQASTVAEKVDALYYFLVAVSAFFSILIAALVIGFAIRYRRESEAELPTPIAGSLKLELIWTLIPLGLAMVMFVWGASVFFTLSRAPAEAIQIWVMGKQWMWKFQHQDGQREINELHIPVGRAVRLTMFSEDTIHSFYVPAFRIKQDVVPGKVSTTWFEATKPGRYHLFCAEYCGTKHSGMIGWVVAMNAGDYGTWLAGGATGESLAEAGAKRFTEQACGTCHRADSRARGPALEGLFGRTVELVGGRQVLADENYIRESIVNPQTKLVAGFPPLMPTYQGLLSEEGLLQLIAYIKSLSASSGGAGQARPKAGGERREAGGDRGDRGSGMPKR